MEQHAKTPKMIRQRRFLTMLPILVLPFLTLIFWSLGGGRTNEAKAQAGSSPGFNIKLPDARLKEEDEMDKMSYYNKARLDSLKFQELIKNDPNYSGMALADSSKYYRQGGGYAQGGAASGINTSLYGGAGFNDPNSQKIYEKLAILNRELNRPAAQALPSENYGTGSSSSSNAKALGTSEVDRLEQMMQMMGQSDGEDPEMQQLNGMLEKILDIQHPDRVQQKLRQGADAKRGQVFAVTGISKENNITVLAKGKGAKEAGFFPLEEEIAEAGQNAIEAVVHENQTLVTGSTIKLRLLNDIRVNNATIPKDSFLYGIVSLSGERLVIKIGSIRYGKSLFPVELQVFDLDGLDGIKIPGAITRDVAKQSADRSLQAIGLNSLDPSIEAQAAGAGIEAVKTLVSKKVKLVKVMVKAGYQILLRDEKQKQTSNQY